MDRYEDSILESFHQAAKSAGLQYYLIGGFAVSYWGNPRFTADVDYVVSQESYEIASKVCEALDYKLVFSHPKGSFAHFASSKNEGFRIDLMIVNQDTWEKLSKESSMADLGGKEAIPIVSPLHLVAMKLHSAKQPDRDDRYKDLNEIAEILLSQQIAFEDLQNEGIIEKYGTEETIAKLREIYPQKSSPNDRLSDAKLRGMQIRAVLRESERWIKLPHVKDKLQSRWSKLSQSQGAPFTL